MKEDVIGILPFGREELSLVEYVKEKLERTFTKRISIKEIAEIPQSAYDPERNQFNSTKILKEILNLYSEENEKIIGITAVDLFIPIFTFVFGEAQLNGKAAVVSYARLKQEFYGLPPNIPLLKERLIKEVIHELGHTFGLIHCEKKWCVMSFSASVKHVDFKKDTFCTECAGLLGDILRR